MSSAGTGEWQPLRHLSTVFVEVLHRNLGLTAEDTVWLCDNVGVSHMAVLVYIPSHSLPSGSVKQPQHIMQPVPTGYTIAEL
ncbi:hypothetical protein ARMGADRAFT_605262 [Armillaria gallica]|uniref:Uncharacterized protein n=1 Tax=Armillaria gallica TaxID=47427 RepID=A0A2H3CSF5_ARMGA|nr:hypothetical protein ARMGADRAFT_605262 [Armillaria gallica]